MIYLAIFIYLILVSVAYGMLLESDAFEHSSRASILTSCIIVWCLVPFLLAILLGRYASVWVRKLDEE